MRLSWGYKIAFSYGGFVILILTMVALTFRQKIELTYEDYYNREVNYQSTLTAIDNFNALKSDLQISQDFNFLQIKLPANAIDGLQNGKLNLLRPSDSKLDLEVPFTSKQAYAINIPKSSLKRGFYLLQVSWKSNEKDFYVERSINVN